MLKPAGDGGTGMTMRQLGVTTGALHVPHAVAGRRQGFGCWACVGRDAGPVRARCPVSHTPCEVGAGSAVGPVTAASCSAEEQRPGEGSRARWGGVTMLT